jgi:error-prone DNA polymerase
MSRGFVELHARSAFSFLRGSSGPEELMKRAAELGMTALGITDHLGFAGSARAHSAALENGLRAIVGSTIELGGGQQPATHLPVLCVNRRGYSALCRHFTEQAFAGQNGCEALPPPSFHGDLIALTGDREGPLASRLLRGDHAGALLAAKRLLTIFGEGNLYVELCRHRVRDDRKLNRLLIELARHLKLPLIASNAPLHATRAGRPLADAFTCLRHHTTLAAASGLLTPNSERHLRSPAEMISLFADLPEAIDHTLIVAERCGFTLENLGYRFPDWHDETGHPLSMAEQTTLLRRRTYAGAAKRHGKLSPAVKRQIEHEIALIHRLGFSGYFLIVEDLVAFARGRGILCQGRGSAANSSVCFALGITHVDPVECGLLFERFLSENRKSWPDIDIDFPSGPHREEVIQYVFHKYGQRGAAMTANVITYQPKSAFREMAKVLGLPESLADRFSQTRVLPWEEIGDRGSKIADGSAEGRPAGDSSTIHNPQSSIRHLYHAVLGLPRHLGQHSGGVIVCDAGLDHIVPLQPAAMPGRHIVQWDKEDCEDLGIVKVDLLGLGMLAAMETTLEISASRGRPVDLAAIPKDDPAVFDLLGRADTVGTFQVESRAQMATLPVMKPKTFYDVAIEVAIIRPGPIVGDLMHPYLNRRNGREPVDFIHPLLEPVLGRTLGVPLFQEQILRTVMILADFNGAEADELRRAMGSRRSTEKMEKMTRLLRERMTLRGVATEAQDKIVKGIGSFALYGFPESHAISFALIAYASCWLKVHRAAEFYAGLINHQPMGFYSVNTLIQDAKRHGIRIQPVSCLHSAAETTVTDDHTLRLGLHRVKSLTHSTAARIVAERGNSPFLSLPDLLARVRPSLAEKRALAAAGTFNGLPNTSHRREALWQAELPLHADLLDGVPNMADGRDRPPGGPGECGVNERAWQNLSAGNGPIHSHFIRRTAAESGPCHAAGSLLDAKTLSNGSPLSPMSAAERLRADLAITGATTGAHPMKLWRQAATVVTGLATSASLHHLLAGDSVVLAGLAICRQRPSTAKGHCFISLEDEFGIANLFVPKKTFEAYRILISTEAYLLVFGKLQRSEGDQPTVYVTHLEALPGAESTPAPESHDFR